LLERLKTLGESGEDNQAVQFLNTNSTDDEIKTLSQQVRREVSLDYWDHFPLFSLKEICAFIIVYYQYLDCPANRENSQLSRG
jgi:hypothetical protein